MNDMRDVGTSHTSVCDTQPLLLLVEKIKLETLFSLT